MKLGKKIIILISLVISLGFLISGYSVGLDPRTWKLSVLFSMTFPLWIVAMIAISVLALVFRNRTSIVVLLLAWAFGWTRVSDYSPWNLPREKKADEQVFTLMTYNVFQLIDDVENNGSVYNQTISSILKSGAQVVALQETLNLNNPIPSRQYTKAQCDSLCQIYPYRAFENGLGVLSQYPVARLKLEEYPTGSAKFAAWTIYNPIKTFVLFNIHLQSFGLKNRDKEAYLELTDGEMSRKTLSEAKKEIFPKVSRALKCHADEAEMLCKDINIASPDGPLILCGDFNDIQGCYAVKTLIKDCGLKDAYRDGAFGPTYTYHLSRFYFNIDHILYRDFPRPVKTWRVKVPASDHYPVLTTLSLD